MIVDYALSLHIKQGFLFKYFLKSNIQPQSK